MTRGSFCLLINGLTWGIAPPLNQLWPCRFVYLKELLLSDSQWYMFYSETFLCTPCCACRVYSKSSDAVWCHGWWMKSRPHRRLGFDWNVDLRRAGEQQQRRRGAESADFKAETLQQHFFLSESDSKKYIYIFLFSRWKRRRLNEKSRFWKTCEGGPT